MSAAPAPATPPAPRRGPGPSRRPHPGFGILRVLVAALALGIGIILLARGDVLLGVLITALGGLRLLMFATVTRRRRRWRAMVGQRRGHAG